MKISCIFLNNNLVDLYINTGYYVHQVAEEIKETSPDSNIDIKEFTTGMTTEQLMKFIIDNSKLESIKSL